MIFFETWFLPVFRVSAPLLFAAMGGLWCERSGVIQIGLEGFMLVGAFFGAVAAHHFQDPWMGWMFAGLGGMGLATIYGISVLHWRANQIVAGTAINLLAIGIPPLLSKIWYDSTGSTPPLTDVARFTIAPLFVVIAVVLISAWVYKNSSWGLRMIFAGEHPKALEAAGTKVLFKRWQGVLLAGLFAGWGGGTLSLYLSSSYTREMSAGRGFIALAALILGKWKPIPTALACLLFGVTEAMQIRLQGVILWGTEPVPVQWIQILPYIITIFVLAGFVGRSMAPKALGSELTE